MAWFEGTHEDTRSLSCSAEVAAAHFANPEAVVAATKGVESSSIDGNIVTLVLEEEDHGVMKFKGTYRFELSRDGGTVRWKTLHGNVDQGGEARFEDAADGCSMVYAETVKLDLEIPSMMAPMLKPVIKALLGNEIKDYLKRMVAGL